MLVFNGVSQKSSGYWVTLAVASFAAATLLLVLPQDRPVYAAAASVHAVICNPQSLPNSAIISYDDQIVRNVGEDNLAEVVCTVPGELDVGPNAEFTVKVTDNNNIGAVECWGYVLNDNGSLAASSTYFHSGGSYVGTKSIVGNISVPPSTAYLFVVRCRIPNVESGQSAIQAISIQ